MKTGDEGLVQKFLNPDELWYKTFSDQNEWRDAFAAIPFEDKGGNLETEILSGACNQ